MREAARHVGGLGGLAEWKVEDLVGRADEIGKELVTDRPREGMSASQIRNFLDEVNRIDAETKGKGGDFDNSRVILLKPLLAYAAGRETNDWKKRNLLKPFTDLFSTAADRVSDAKDFKRFVDFTRAVVAYHRFHGGSNQ